MIQDFDYDAASRQLTIRFTTGRVYLYGRVPEEVVVELAGARSRGAFFNRHIRGRYPYRELAAA